MGLRCRAALFSTSPFARFFAILIKPRLAISREEWQRSAQPGELAFHQQDRYRRGVRFAVDSARIFGHFGLGAHDYQAKTILDLGAGSRLRTRYFQGAHLIAVEPLADEYRKLDFSDLDEADEVYAVAAEQFLPECDNRVDLLVSINVLDHCYDFDAIIANVRRYLAKNGQALLSFDSHVETDPLHPLILTPRVCREVFRKHGLRILHESKGFGGDLSREHYGHPPYALNYLLELVEEEVT